MRALSEIEQRVHDALLPQLTSEYARLSSEAKLAGRRRGEVIAIATARVLQQCGCDAASIVRAAAAGSEAGA